MIIRVLTALMLVFSLAVVVPACSKSPCEKLQAKICDGKSDSYCKKTKKWLDKQLAGPGGKKMPEKQTKAACKMILDDSKALAAWKRNAKRKIK